MTEETQAKIEELFNDVAEGKSAVAFAELDPKVVNVNPGPESKAIWIGEEVKGYAEAVLKDSLRAKKPLARYRFLVVID